MQELRWASRGHVLAGTAARGRKRKRGLRIPQRLVGSWDRDWKPGSRVWFGVGGDTESWLSCLSGGGLRGVSPPFPRP